MSLDSAPGTLRVFLNYRRGDTRHVAGRLSDMINIRFGSGSCFMDVESIALAEDYVEAIDDAIGGSNVLLVLIGDRWLKASDDQGNRRIDDPADRLRLEVETGLRKTETHVIPVLVDSASMPRSKDLPESLAPLSRHHAARLDHESFKSDADHLLREIEQLARDSGADGGRPDAEDGRQRTARLLSFCALVAVLLTLFAFRSGVRDFVAASRPDQPPDGPWASLTWMLPALPVLAATWLAATRKRLGVALGCTAAAALWVCISLIFVVWKQPDPATRSAHIILFALLIAALAGLLVASSEALERVRLNRWDRALVGCVLVLVAMVLRAQPKRVASMFTTTGGEPADLVQLLDRPPFWIAVLMPLLVALPGAVLLCNKVQAQALLTLVSLQVVYAALLRSMALGDAIGDGDVLALVLEDLVFLAGSVCMLLAVRVGQPRDGQPRNGHPARDAGVSEATDEHV